MKKLIIIVTLCIAFFFKGHAQLLENLSIGFESNSQWYNDDKKTGDFPEEEHFRSNNYLKLDYRFKNWFAGTQFEAYEPMPLLNYSPNLDETNIALYYAGYDSKKLKVTAGYFYEQFGSGLSLRSWEDRQLGLNNALRGGKIEYRPLEILTLKGLYGKHRVGFDTSEGEIFGGDVEIDLSKILTFKNTAVSLGFNYVGRTQDSSFEDSNFDDLTNLFSGRLDFSSGNLYSSLEYVHKSDDAIVQIGQILNSFVKPGNALLINLGYSNKGFGVDATFRRTENMDFYSDRDKEGNEYNENIVNYIPALTKQHDYLLTNIYVYQAQPNVSFPDPSLVKFGEIGGQIDIYFNLKKESVLGGKHGTKIAINGSYWANLRGDFNFSPTEQDYETDFLGFGEKYFSDISLEIRKKWSSKFNSIFYYVNQYYNSRYIEETSGRVKANIVVAEGTYKMSKGKSLRFEAQHLFSDDDLKDWVGGTLEFNFNHKLNFFVNDIYNYGNDDRDERIHYYNLGTSYSTGAHRFALSYGRQRGGLVCVGGICRFVPESTGLTINIVAAF